MSSRKRVKCFSAWGSFEVRDILRGRGEAEEPSLGGASRELACGRYATRRIRWADLPSWRWQLCLLIRLRRPMFPRISSELDRRAAQRVALRSPETIVNLKMNQIRFVGHARNLKLHGLKSLFFGRIVD